MDNGKQKLVEMYRVQFNNKRGPYKGGIRFHQTADLDEVKTLALSRMKLEHQRKKYPSSNRAKEYKRSAASIFGSSII